MRVAVNLTVGYRETGRWETARKMGNRAVFGAVSAKLPALEAMAAGNLGDVAMATGDFVEAEAWYDRAGQLARNHELVGEEAELLRRRAELALRAGKDALSLAERASVQTQGMPAEHARATMLWQVARARIGAPADVMPHLDAVSEPLLEQGDQGGLAWARLWAAEAAAEAGLLNDARELVQQVGSWAAEVGQAELSALSGALQERLRPPRAAGAERVLELASELSQYTDANTILAEVARTACELLDADRACVAVPREEGHALVAFSSVAFDPSSSVLRVVLSDQREVLATDLGDRADLRMRSSVHAMELRSVLCVPIVDRGEVLGALYADSRTASRRQLSESVGPMRGLANLAGMALVRLRTDALAAAEAANREQLARLQAAEAEVHALAERLRARNDELVELNRALAAAADAERAAAESRARFLATMSHEFRTPMNGVLGMVDLLETLPATAQQRAHLAVIRRSGELMLGMVDRVLTSSRLEANRYELDLGTFDLIETCRRVVEQVRFSPFAEGLDLRLDLGAVTTATVSGDEGSLQQVLLNLLGNAVRFTDDGAVELRVRREGDHWRFRVSDTGIGIAEDDQASIFEPFVQVGSSRRGGTGLGLSITSELVALMGGAIRCSSQPGVGTTFSFVLDLPAAEHTGDTDAAVQPTVHGRRVLVVEDNAVNVMVAVRQLESFGCVAEYATTLRAAREALASRGPYDLLLLDWELPDGTGGDFATEIRAAGLAPGAPLVALTAHCGEASRLRSFDHGLDDHMVKPLRREDLAVILQRWLPESRECLHSARGLVAS